MAVCRDGQRYVHQSVAHSCRVWSRVGNWEALTVTRLEWWVAHCTLARLLHTDTQTRNGHEHCSTFGRSPGDFNCCNNNLLFFPSRAVAHNKSAQGFLSLSWSQPSPGARLP